MIALQHASAGKTDTPRSTSLTFSSLIVANMLMEAVCDVVIFVLALMLQWWMLCTIAGPWQPGMTDAQLHEASQKAVELGVQMLEEERVKRER